MRAISMIEKFVASKPECCSRSTVLAGEHLWQNTLLLLDAEGRQSNDLLRNQLEQRGTKLSSQIAPLCATSVFSVFLWLVLAVN
jgi:hypothetical protein